MVSTGGTIAPTADAGADASPDRSTDDVTGTVRARTDLGCRFDDLVRRRPRVATIAALAAADLDAGFDRP